MKVGVIGGSGFIGSHVVDKLLDHGHDVTVFDIMKPHRNDIRHIYIDINDLSKTTVALTGDYDAVYMLAAMADVNDVYRNPVEAGQINIMGVANVLEASRRNDIDRVILASTVWVSGLALDENVDENTLLSIQRADHIYTSSKLAAELYCHGYQRLYGQEFTILRYGIPYGPRARRGTVISAFVQRALNGDPLTIYGDGSQYRAFIYVEDLAEGNALALKSIAKNETYNLSGIRKVTIREIAEIISQLIGNVEIRYEGARPGDYEGKDVSNDKARIELGWEPKVDFEEGVEKYIEWFKLNFKDEKNR